MPLEIQQRDQEGIQILDLSGKLIMGEEDISFRETFQALLNRGQQKLVINCKNLEDLDDVGISTLVYAKEALEKAGGDLALANMKVEHLELLEVLKLEAFFPVFETVNDAVNSFFPERHVERVDVLQLVRTLMKKSRGDQK